MLGWRSFWREAADEDFRARFSNWLWIRHGFSRAVGDQKSAAFALRYVPSANTELEQKRMMDSTKEPSVMTRTIVEFCRFARDKGLPAGVQGTLDALEAAVALGVGSEQALKFGLRSVLCSSKDDWDIFEECFKTFWKGAGAGAVIVPHDTSRERRLFRRNQTRAEFPDVNRFWR